MNINPQSKDSGSSESVITNKRGFTGKEIFVSTSTTTPELPFDEKNVNESLNPTQPESESKWLDIWLNWFHGNSSIVNPKGHSNNNDDIGYPMYTTGH